MKIAVETSQNVVVEFEASTAQKRAIALLIDLVIRGLIALAFFLLYLLLAFIFWFTGSTIFLTFYYVLAYSVIIGYDLILEYFNNGQSIGKKMMKIRVVSLDGYKPSFYNLFIRWIFWPIDITMLLGTVAYISVGITKNSQRIGDILAGTTVVDLFDSKRHEVLLMDKLKFEKTYKVTYPNLTSALNDKDIQTIIQLVKKYGFRTDVLKKLVIKVESITGALYSPQEHKTFQNYLALIINDYNFMSLQKTLV